MEGKAPIAVDELKESGIDDGSEEEETEVGAEIFPSSITKLKFSISNLGNWRAARQMKVRPRERRRSRQLRAEELRRWRRRRRACRGAGRGKMGKA